MICNNYRSKIHQNNISVEYHPRHKLAVENNSLVCPSLLLKAYCAARLSTNN
jgi:hypothetical protein